VTFSDNGQGIPQETQKRIFDPFFTTSRKEQAWLVYRSQDLGQHNALIDIKSKENKGTSFYLRFPLCEGVKGNDTI
jgi:signal transduction histidine kinase